MKVRIKRLFEDAKLPTKAHADDAGFDLYAHSKSFDDEGNVVYGVGVAFEVPKGYVGLLFPRSSNAKKDLLLSNSVGILDSGYRGEVLFKFKPSMVFYEGRPTHAMSKNIIYEIDDPAWVNNLALTELLEFYYNENIRLKKEIEQFKKVEGSAEGWYEHKDTEYMCGFKFEEPVELPVDVYVREKIERGEIK